MLEQFGINLPGIIAQVINFAILLVVLYVIAYKPITRMLDERSKRISESMEQSERIKEQAARAGEEIKARIEEARKEGQTLVTQAGQIGERIREETRQHARSEAEAIIARARLELQRERDEAIDQLRREFVDLAILAAEKVINETLDKAAHRRIIDEILEKSTTLQKG